jgi:hypothetical protein
MPAPKKPASVQQKLLARTGGMDDTQLPYMMMDSLIANYHPELAEAVIVIGYNYGWKPSRDGKIVLAKITLFPDFERQLHGKDAKLIINYGYWHNPATRDDNRNALIDHHLSHMRPMMDQELDIPLRNEMGMIRYYHRGHDIEDFNDVVSRWGIWMMEMEKSAEVMAAAWEKERLAREARSNEELEEEGADGEMSERSEGDPREAVTTGSIAT